MSVNLIVVDAGHGMSNRKWGTFDTGAVFPHPELQREDITEAEIVWDWYKTIRYVSGVVEGAPAVVGTREAFMSYLSLNRRPEVARRLGGDRLLSIHVNAGGGTGCEAFGSTNGDLEWADYVLGCCAVATGLENRGVKKRSLAVLNHAHFKNPACLLEIGFGDDPDDLRAITTRLTRIKFANLLLGGITNG